MSPASTVVWSREEEKSFENAIALHWDETEQWDTIASMVPSKSLDEIKHHYQLLAQDVSAIEAGHVPIPTYLGEEASSSSSHHNNNNHHGGFSGYGDKRSNCGFGGGFSGMGVAGGGGGGGGSETGHGGGGGKGGSRSEQERKKGIPWTEEEHKLFLVGLEKFGKGDWRSISRNFVVTRTPTQVASHAQKYFIRLNSMNRDRRRSSIHDITSINGSGGGGGDVSAQQPPITGQQTNLGVGAAMNPAMVPPPLKHRPPLNMPGMGMYGAPMGHPVAGPGHMGSAVGTPVMLPPGHHHHHHSPYVVPMAYPMAPPPMHQ